MIRSQMAAALLLVVALRQTEALTHTKDPKISPPLRDVKSDKKFFGPPFPADYPEDTRPVPDRSILNKLKSPDQPYPALQSKDQFDRDFVKDENADTGAWKAQFEYDSLRKKLASENEAARRAAAAAADAKRRL